MTQQEAKSRLFQLHNLGDVHKLTVFGFLRGHGQYIIHNFSAGKIEIDPDIFAAGSADNADYRLRYSSWDGQRTQDITDLSDEEFIVFMRSEPAGLKEI